MAIKESGEMYLETILILEGRSDFVRAVDIAKEMNFSKPSVSVGLSILKKNGYVDIAANGKINLTESGRALAEKIIQRHEVLTAYFQMLGVSPQTAEEDACRMEHVISDETFDILCKELDRLKNK